MSYSLMQVIISFKTLVKHVYMFVCELVLQNYFNLYVSVGLDQLKEIFTTTETSGHVEPSNKFTNPVCFVGSEDQGKILPNY